MREDLLHPAVTPPQTVEKALAELADVAGLNADQRQGIAHAFLQMIQLSQGQAQLSVWQERCAKQLMLKHLDSGIQISAVAQECCLSRSHFSRAFKNTTGHAPRDWLRLARLTRARELLVQTDCSITQVSLECGFADQAHFTRIFSREFGVTPRKWRVNHRAEQQQKELA